MQLTAETEVDAAKRRAGESAAALVMSGMIVGLGTGSTAIFAVRKIAERLKSGELRGVVGVPTSLAVAVEARRLGIPLLSEELPLPIDLTIDGADEVDPRLNLIKGAGGALLREKIVAQSSRRLVIVVDDQKLTPQLGARRPLPVEVLPFGWLSAAAFLDSLGALVLPRLSPDGKLFHTDQGNLILDCAFGAIPDTYALASTLEARAGIIGHGMFLGLATDVIVAGEGGTQQFRRTVAEASGTRSLR